LFGFSLYHWLNSSEYPVSNHGLYCFQH
jgi:hypothetical protein